jgi:hypothetical protein
MTALGRYVADQTIADPILALATRPSFTVLFDFRDLVLKRSQIGREFLALYHAHGLEVLEALEKHPPMLRRVLTLLCRATVLAQDALRAHTYAAHEVTSGALELDAKTVHELKNVIADFTNVTPNRGFHALVSRYGEIVDKLEGMKMRDVLKALAVEPFQATVP